MARITIRSECPDCGKKIKFVAEAKSEVRGKCPQCGCWMKVPVGSVGTPEPKSSGPDSALPLITDDSSRPRPPAAPQPPLPNARPAAPKAKSSPALKPVALTPIALAPVAVPPTVAPVQASFWSRWGLSIGVLAASVAAVGVSVALLRSGKSEDSAAVKPAQVAVAGNDVVGGPGAGQKVEEKPGSSTTSPAPNPLLVVDNRPVAKPSKPRDPSDLGGARGRETKFEKEPLAGLGERYALLVSVRDYDEDTTGLTSLQYTEADVNELAKVLVKSGYREHNVTVMSQSKAITKFHLAPERTRILEQLDRILSDRQPEDTILIAFAGHGVKFQGSDDSFFCPLGTDLDDRSSLIAYREVYDRLATCKAGFKLMLSDACRNEPLAKSGARRATVNLDSVTRPPEPPRTGGVAAFFACSPEQVAFENKELGHGVFFHYVIKGLEGEADLLKDGQVTLGELVPYVTKQTQDFVGSTFAKKQSPNFFGDVKGEFTLVRLPKELKPAEPPVSKDPGKTVATTPTVPSSPGSPSVGTPGTAKPGAPPVEEPPIPLIEELVAKNRIPDGTYPPTVVVPPVKGETVVRARAMLHELGLGLDFVGLAQDTDIVGSQGIIAGKTVPSRTIVRLGNLKAKVPNVVGMSYREACRVLQEREGFKVLSALPADSELTITDQVPSAGALEMRGSRITINHMVPVPNVTTLDVDSAIRRLEEVGLKCSVTTRYQKGDTVFFQSIKGKIAVGLEVKLTPGVLVPDITNMTLSQANSLLVRSGINGRVAATQTIKTSDSTLVGEPVVTRQSVAAGQVMSRQVDLSVHCLQYQYVR